MSELQAYNLVDTGKLLPMDIAYILKYESRSRIWRCVDDKEHEKL